MAASKTLTKRKALGIVIALSLVLVCFILVRWLFFPGQSYDFSCLEGRRSFLLSLGWEIDPDSEEYRSVRVPEKLEGIMSQYNRMQLSQGYDLTPYLGQSCQQYSYRLINYPDSSEEVFVTLYVYESLLIAADIHSNTLNGFMHGLKRVEPK